jgi:hypothetical protein
MSGGSIIATDRGVVSTSGQSQDLVSFVDTANVTGSRPDGRWRHRAAGATRPHNELEPWNGAEVTLPAAPGTVHPPAGGHAGAGCGGCRGRDHRDHPRVAFGTLLRDVAKAIRDFGALVRAEADEEGQPHPEELAAALDSAGEARARLTELLLVDPRTDPEQWQLTGALLTATDRALRELDLDERERLREAQRGLLTGGRRSGRPSPRIGCCTPPGPLRRLSPTPHSGRGAASARRPLGSWPRRGWTSRSVSGFAAPATSLDTGRPINRRAETAQASASSRASAAWLAKVVAISRSASSKRCRPCRRPTARAPRTS